MRRRDIFYVLGKRSEKKLLGLYEHNFPLRERNLQQIMKKLTLLGFYTI